MGDARKPNVLFIMGDDIGWHDISACNLGVMGYRTPKIYRIAREGDGRPSRGPTSAGGPRTLGRRPRRRR